MEIERVAVLGAGVMGAGIAAQVANAGVPVLLLDIVPDGPGDRNAIASGAVARMLDAEPAAFMRRKNARLVTPGNLADDLERLGEVDWIIEAIIERLDLKRDLFERVEAVRKPGSIVSSNTSTIPLAALTEGMSERFRADFLITHFFNPPRYMRLVELVAGPETRPEVADTVSAFADLSLGKGVVWAKDTPGFIANRIGTLWLQSGLTEAIAAGVPVEAADAIIGRPMGIPRTGVFGLLDLIGLDLMPRILESMTGLLPAGDPFHEAAEVPPLLTRMLETGYTGRKGKGGFYRLNRAGGKRVKEAIDLATGDYHPAARPELDCIRRAGGDLRALFDDPEPAARYAWRVMSRTLAYAASLVPEIADDIVAVDEAMRLGYSWTEGPFELIDRLGSAWFAERLRREGRPVPALLEMAGDRRFYPVEAGRSRYLEVGGRYRDVERPAGTLRLADVKRAGKAVAANRAASLWDIGDGVLCLEFHTKMNAIEPGTLAMVRTAVETVRDGHRALVIYNEGDNFSVGANVGLALFLSHIALWPAVEAGVREGQEAYQALRYAPFPVVGAPSGMALGGGCEILLHCDAVQAHAESYLGLVEVGVGLVPGWGGCATLLGRWMTRRDRPGGPMPAITKVFETISLAKVSKSAPEARDLLFLRPEDGITMNRARLLADAKARALALAEGYTPPEPVEIRLPGRSAAVAMEMAVDGFRKRGLATPHDTVVAGQLARVLSGGDTDLTESVAEGDLLALEREALVALVRTPETVARIEHMLETGKPLRN